MRSSRLLLQQASQQDLVVNPAIIRARAKMVATIEGARIWCAMENAGDSFADWCWSFTDGKVLTGDGESSPAATPLSESISKAMKKRGFKFVGATIVYAWMQAVATIRDTAFVESRSRCWPCNSVVRPYLLRARQQLQIRREFRARRRSSVSGSGLSKQRRVRNPAPHTQSRYQIKRKPASHKPCTNNSLQA